MICNLRVRKRTLCNPKHSRVTSEGLFLSLRSPTHPVVLEGLRVRVSSRKKNSSNPKWEGIVMNIENIYDDRVLSTSLNLSNSSLESTKEIRLSINFKYFP